MQTLNETQFQNQIPFVSWSEELEHLRCRLVSTPTQHRKALEEQNFAANATPLTASDSHSLAASHGSERQSTAAATRVRLHASTNPRRN